MGCVPSGKPSGIPANRDGLGQVPCCKEVTHSTESTLHCTVALGCSARDPSLVRSVGGLESKARSRVTSNPTFILNPLQFSLLRGSMARDCRCFTTVISFGRASKGGWHIHSGSDLMLADHRNQKCFGHNQVHGLRREQGEKCGICGGCPRCS